MHHLVKQALPLSLVRTITDQLTDAAARHGVDSNRHFDARMKMFFVGHARYVADIVALPQIRDFVHSRLQKPVVQHAYPLIKGAHAPETLPHQDAPFWRYDTKRTMFSLWIALEGVDESNGCLRFGVETRDIVPHEHVDAPGGKTWRIQNPADMRYVDAPMERGDAVFFDSTQIHAAYPNATDGHRYSMKIVFGDGESLPSYWYPCDDVCTASYYRHNKEKAFSRIKRRIRSAVHSLARRLKRADAP
jgi:ectoine hydroxylase-related dioxygenase (phytanoyl-CoA dioxygenase family)